MSHPDFVYSIVITTEDLVSGKPEEGGEAEIPGVHAELRHRVSRPTLGEVTCKLFHLSLCRTSASKVLSVWFNIMFSRTTDLHGSS